MADASLRDDDPTGPDRGLEVAEGPDTPADRFAGPYKIADIYLHISDESQREDARLLARGLAASGYTVLGIELVPAPAGRNRSVRYYYGQQSDEADYLGELCATIASGLNGRAAWADASSYRTISLEGRYDGLPRNRVEIWL